MRQFFRALFRILSAPFRLLFWPFRLIGEFVNREPEDSDTIDALANTIENPSVLLEHLDALRKHLLRAVIALAITTSLSFSFAAQVLDFLAQPVGGIEALQAIEVTESISAFMRVSIMSGLVLAFPYIFLEFFLFANPGLRKRERVFVLSSVPVAMLLMVAGMAFAYYIMLPAALPFLLGFMGIQTIPRPANYIRFVTGVMFWIGVSFQFPLIIYAMARIGWVKARALAKGWRIAVVGIAIFAAAVTPTVDPVNMGLVMAPMIVLYTLSIGLARIAEGTRRRRMARAAA